MNGILTSAQVLILVQPTTQTKMPLTADPSHFYVTVYLSFPLLAPQNDILFHIQYPCMFISPSLSGSLFQVSGRKPWLRIAESGLAIKQKG